MVSPRWRSFFSAQGGNWLEVIPVRPKTREWLLLFCPDTYLHRIIEPCKRWCNSFFKAFYFAYMHIYIYWYTHISIYVYVNICIYWYTYISLVKLDISLFVKAIYMHIQVYTYINMYIYWYMYILIYFWA